VALKVLAPRLTTTPEFVGRFRREGRILAQLSHQNIVTVYDAGEARGCYYLAMELVRGPTLEQGLSRWGRLQPKHATNIALQMAKALEYAHLKRIIHRDIKPANILLDRKRLVKVADFGIVAMLGDSQVARTRIGTPRYMAYEQFNGAATPQSDLYGLGVCLYEMLTGQLPPAFGLETPIPARKLNPAVSPALDHVILKTLQPDPKRRYATVREFILALKQATARQK
jgi:serine/threonine-protein kinase